MMDNFEVNRQYAKYNPSYIKDYDAYDGQETIKAKTETYLPKLAGQAADSTYGAFLYDIYLQSALWFPATGSTVRGYLGIMFRKAPILEVSSDLEYVNEQFADDGSTINAVAKNLSKEVILRYRPAVLVDFPSTSTEGLMKADVEKLQLRPYVITYTSNQIEDWHERVGNGKKKIDFVQLDEKHDVGRSRYAKEIEGIKYKPLITDGQYTIKRILELIPHDGRPEVYKQSIYVKTEGKKKGDNGYVKIDEVYPISNGDYLSYLPIVPCSEDGTQWDLDYSLINDLVNLNIADYNNEALYRDNLKFLARPTICVKGYMHPEGTDKKSINTGSSQVWEFDENGNSWLLGGDASQASALVESAKGLKSQMSTVGLRSLASDPNGVESSETATIHRSGEHGTLSNVALAVSDCLTKVLEIIQEWMDGKGEVTYTVQTDFIPTKIDPATLRTLWEMYTNGDLPLSQFMYNLKKGEVLETTVTEDEFEDAKADKPPVEPVVVTEPVEDEILED